MAADGTAVLFHNGLRNGQSQTEAAVIAAAVVGTVKAVKKVRQLFRRNRFRAVFCLQYQLLVCLLQRQPDIAAVGGVFDGIVQQDPQQLLQLRRVALQNDILLNMIAQRMAGFIGHRFKAQRRIHHQIAEIHRGKLGEPLGIFGAG